MGTRYEFIINPGARSGRGEKTWKMIKAELEKCQADYGVHKTKYKGHAGEIAAALSSSGRRCIIVVVGGDGTVNEVVNGLNITDSITLGYIPLGSGNDFARGLKIPGKPKDALRSVLSPKNVMQMDIGMLSDGKKTMKFAVSGGMGFDASVCYYVSVSRWKNVLNRIHLGKLVYAAVAVGRLFKDKPVSAELIMENGRKRVFEKMMFAAFMNLPCEGGGFRFAPDAKPDDGVMDVFIAAGISKIKILFLLPAAYLGGRLNYRGITRIRCRSLRIRTKASVIVHTDGETDAGWRQAEVQMLPEKLTVIAG